MGKPSNIVSQPIIKDGVTKLGRQPKKRDVASIEELNEELLSLFRRTGEATNYWPNYFLRSVRTEGGLAVAKKLLAPGRVSSGFDSLIKVQRVDLSIESIALEPRFSHLFTEVELEVARERLEGLPLDAFPVYVKPEVFTEEVSETVDYQEGSVRSITINEYERNLKARNACIQHHGLICAVCEMNFEEKYGVIGRGFIHVHHKRPLSNLKNYKVDPKKDLVPVCPNCHAMLHRRHLPLDIEQLRAMLIA